MTPQSGVRDQFDCTVNYINSNLNCESQRIYKKIEKIVEDRVRIHNQCITDSNVFLLFKGENYV